MKAVRQRPSLDRPAVYEIKVPGELDESWATWFGTMSVSVDSEGEGSPVTTLTGAVDQAALHSLLRRLYSLGLPLISATCVGCGKSQYEPDLHSRRSVDAAELAEEDAL
ncbi:MAG: hypothetical protein ACK2UU_08285 [Anaerolineae bacterium]|jgi:hypothetical protein